jgi:hypothetical protein
MMKRPPGSPPADRCARRLAAYVEADHRVQRGDETSHNQPPGWGLRKPKVAAIRRAEFACYVELLRTPRQSFSGKANRLCVRTPAFSDGLPSGRSLPSPLSFPLRSSAVL